MGLLRRSGPSTGLNQERVSPMNVSGLLAVGLGGLLGCWLRWGLAVLLTPLLPTLPLGTLAVNLIGGLLIGVSLAVFGQFPALPPPLKLLLTTGFLGGLTTFSTFSGESIQLLLRQQYGWFVANVGANLLGSLALTLLGFCATRALLRPSLG